MLARCREHTLLPAGDIYKVCSLWPEIQYYSHHLNSQLYNSTLQSPIIPSYILYLTLPPKANMKFSLLTVTLSTLAAASPTPEMEHEKRALGLLKPKTSNIPFTFTSTYEITATPNQVVDAENKFTGGLKNSHGLFKYGINSHEDIICFNITLYGFRGEYESLANTATHIHEGVKGKAGPPRYVDTWPMNE